MANYAKLAQIRTPEQFRERLRALGCDIPVDDDVLSIHDDSPMAQPYRIGSLDVGNRWCIHPMEGWDANRDGSPSELTMRRWRNFGRSGAKLIWGGEAAAVQPGGRANPNQTLAVPANETGLRRLLDSVNGAHTEAFGSLDRFVVGLQLTHSGRFSRPNSKRLEPKIAYHHPLLDQKFGIASDDDSIVWTDDGLERLIDSYVLAAETAARAGFAFVDIKACHGYLLHEFLSARVRPGKYGGDFDGRTRLLLTIIDRVRQSCPRLAIVIRLSLFDSIPYQPSRGVGQPMEHTSLLPYEYGFGVNLLNPREIDLDEPIELLRRLVERGVVAANLSCGSPYYNPHLQRPAIFPPSDGYQPPEDPLIGVARQLNATRDCKQRFPNLPIVGTGYSYLQDFLPHVAQAVVRDGWADAVGLGRVVLSYPDLPADTLFGRPLQRKRICRTFSDCTTAPRHGLVSGCYPLDTFYKQRPERDQLQQIKRQR